MGSLEDRGGGREFDVEETIFVAVGKQVDKGKKTLSWAVRSFPTKKICLLHVHRPTHVFALTEGKFSRNKLKQHMVEALWKLERKKMHDLLDEYLIMLSQAGIQANNVWMEMDTVEKGIVEIVAQYNIKWLVMGAAADKYYSKELVDLKSSKAMCVNNDAPVSCQIWFICDGYLIRTRESIKDECQIEDVPPLLELDATVEKGRPGLLPLKHSVYSPASDVLHENTEQLEGELRKCSLYLEHPSWSADELDGPSGSSTSMADEEATSEGQPSNEIDETLELAMIGSRNLEQKMFQEAVKRWKEEDDAMEAKCKAKALESLCVKEIRQRQEMEELLTREKEEAERTNNQSNEYMRELQLVKDQTALLENQFSESQCNVKELEEKIISAVELLISFKKKRDEMQIERDNAIRQVKHLRLLVSGEVADLCGTEMLEFSFLEINNATSNFDPSLKIGEGKYGSLYKGLLHHVRVTIKMLPTYGSQSLLGFEKGVEILSRVRHPNLVTLIGTCREYRSLVYEYLRNGSLEDRLACKDKSPPLPWQTRMSAASEICSALVFLHSNKPCIIHGSLKPSKILFDSNFMCKLNDFGFYLFVAHEKSTYNLSGSHNGLVPDLPSVYVDPVYLETGKMTLEADVFSFGMILIQLLTGKKGSRILKDIKCAMEEGNFRTVLDSSAGDWPLAEALQLAQLALRCSERNPVDRPELASEVLSVLELMKDSYISSTLDSGMKELHRIPSHFVCPILQEVMKDPQIAADGYTYEAEAIQGWLQSGHNTSPMTNLKLEHLNLLPNYAVHQAIIEWQQNW